jgi:DNA-binding LytR/AlgR family response regulator
MHVRIETVAAGEPEEIVIYCRKVTPAVESFSQQLSRALSAAASPGTGPTAGSSADPAAKNPPSLAFFKGDQQYYLLLREILFFETEGEQVFAHTADAYYEVKLRLYELSAILPGYFVRVSRSAIVSTLHVFAIKKGLTRVSQITFRNSHKEVYGSRLYAGALSDKMEARAIYDDK